METLKLEELKESITLFSPVQCDFLTENCIVALEENDKSSGCTLIVEGDTPTKFNLAWSTKVSRNGYKEPRKIIEHAAEAISFFLSSNLTEYSVIEEALIGSGIDYWLGYDEDHVNYDSKNFIRARLEISGINEEKVNNSINSRVGSKKTQSLKSSNTNLPIYISIVEFSGPRAFFARL